MRTTRLTATAAILGFWGLLVPVAPAATRIEKNLALEPGGVLILDADSGAIDVTGGSPSGVRVVITSDKSDLEERYEFTFEEHPGEAKIMADRKGDGLLGFFSGWNYSGNMKFEIQVPTKTSLRFETAGGAIRVSAVEGEAQLDTAGGSIDVQDLGGELVAETAGGSIRIARVAGDVNADTSGGSIDVQEVTGRVTADTSGGSIEMSGISGDISADTAGGSIEIRGAGGRVNADTSGGSVDVSFASGNSRGGSLSAAGGGVSVTLDPGVGLQIDAEASGGKVACDLAVTSKDQGASSRVLRGALGPGGELLKLRAAGGSIRIRPL